MTEPQPLQVFMHCTRCDRYAGNWNVNNEAYSCPCGMDESGLELIDPWSLVGRTFTGRNGVVTIVEYLGGNTFRTRDSRDIYFITSILSLEST